MKTKKHTLFLKRGIVAAILAILAIAISSTRAQTAPKPLSLKGVTITQAASDHPESNIANYGMAVFTGDYTNQKINWDWQQGGTKDRECIFIKHPFYYTYPSPGQPTWEQRSECNENLSVGSFGDIGEQTVTLSTAQDPAAISFKVPKIPPSYYKEDGVTRWRVRGGIRLYIDDQGNTYHSISKNAQGIFDYDGKTGVDLTFTEAAVPSQLAFAGQGAKCGNAICQSSVENPYTCPADCGQPKTYSAEARFQSKGGTAIIGNIIGNIIQLKNTGSNADTFRVSLLTNTDNRCGIKLTADSDPADWLQLPKTLDVTLAVNEMKPVSINCVTKDLKSGPFSFSVRTVSLGAEAVARNDVPVIMGEDADTITLEEIVCNDPDNEDAWKMSSAVPRVEPSVKGTTTGKAAYQTYTDSCKDTTTVWESSCGSQGPVQATFVCGYGCTDGKCRTKTEFDKLSAEKCANKFQCTNNAVYGKAMYNLSSDSCTINAIPENLIKQCTEDEICNASSGVCDTKPMVPGLAYTIILKQLFPGQYNNTKFSIHVEDPDGLKEFLLTKANGDSIYGGNPPSCMKSVDSSTITLEPKDFPLKGSVLDCRKGAVKYDISVSNPNIAGPTEPQPPTNQNWVKHMWYFLDGSAESFILNLTDKEYLNYISNIDARCKAISKSKFSWMPDAGNDKPENWKNFGIPDCSGVAQPLPQPLPQPPGPIEPPISNNWTKRIWNFADGSTSESYVLGRTDLEYLDYLGFVSSQCKNIPKDKFAWRLDAGNDKPENWKNFGIPDCSGTAQPQPQPPFPPPPDMPLKDEMCKREIKTMREEIKGFYAWLRDFERTIPPATVQQPFIYKKPPDMSDFAPPMPPLISQFKKTIADFEEIVTKASFNCNQFDVYMPEIKKRRENINALMQSFKVDLKFVAECRALRDDATRRLKELERETTRSPLGSLLKEFVPRFQDLVSQANKACDNNDQLTLDVAREDFQNLEEELRDIYERGHEEKLDTYIKAQIEQFRNVIEKASAFPENELFIEKLKRIVDEIEIAYEDGDTKRAIALLEDASRVRARTREESSPRDKRRERENIDVFLRDLEGRFSEEVINRIVEKVVSKFSEKVTALIDTQTQTVAARIADFNKNIDTLSQSLASVTALVEEKRQEILEAKEGILARAKEIDDKMKTLKLKAQLKKELEDTISYAATVNWCGELGNEVKAKMTSLLAALEAGNIVREDIEVARSFINERAEENKNRCYEEEVMPYKDFHMHEWFFPAALFNTEQGFIRGRTDAAGNPVGDFEPSRATLRIEALAMAMKIFNVTIGDTLPPHGVTGVPEWGYGYINAARHAKIELDYAKPWNVAITRMEAAEMLYAFARNQGLVEVPRAFDQVEDYLDYAKFKSDKEAVRAIEAMSDLGVFQGSDGYFKFDAPLLRSEFSAVNQRLFQTLEPAAPPGG